MAFNRNYDPSLKSDEGWNYAEEFCKSLNDLNKLIDECSRISDFVGVYRLQKRVYARLKYLILKKKDNKLFEGTYDSHKIKIEEKFSAINKLIGGKVFELNKSVVSNKLEELDELLYYFQWDLGLIFPERQYKSWEDEFKEEFE